MAATSAPVPLIVFAVPEETKAFLKLVRPARRKTSERELVFIHPTGQLSSREPCWPTRRVLTTGMGQKNARAAFEASCQAARPSLVLTCGFAGGLDARLPLGTVLFQADEGFPLTPGLRSAGAQPGSFHCAGRVAVTVAEKAALRHATGADAVEMESSVIRELCRQRGIPSATVRVISDTAEEDLPLDFNALMTSDYRLNFLRLAGRLARSPGKIPELMRFQKRANFAADRLAETLRRVLGGTL